MPYAIIYVIFQFGRYLYYLFFDRTVLSTVFFQHLCNNIESIAEAIVSAIDRRRYILKFARSDFCRQNEYIQILLFLKDLQVTVLKCLFYIGLVIINIL